VSHVDSQLSHFWAVSELPLEHVIYDEMRGLDKIFVA
jgi:hypothetical protein